MLLIDDALLLVVLAGGATGFEAEMDRGELFTAGSASAVSAMK